MANSLPGRRGRAPRTDPEWAREIQRRLAALEQSTTLRIGDWVLSGTDDGHLTAHTAEGRSAVLTGITDISQIDTLAAKVNELDTAGSRNKNDLQSLIDAIVKGFTAWTGQSNFDTSAVQDFSNTVGQALGTLGTLGLRLQKLENGGALILEDFATYPDSPSLGSKWLQWESGTGQGTLWILNKYAQYNIQLDNVKRTAFALHKTSAGTALHRVSATISTPQDVFGQSENFLIARAKYATDTDYVFAAMTWTKVRLGYVKAGQVTELIGRDWLFKNGSTYSLDCSVPNTVRLLENTNVLLEAALDAGAPTGEYTGFAAYAPNGAARPGVLGSYAVFDDSPSA